MLMSLARQAARRLAEWLADQAAWERVVSLSQRILQQDDCWENAYRLLMLAWALWLAFALLGWLRWGWQCLASDGLWRATGKRATRAAETGADPR